MRVSRGTYRWRGDGRRARFRPIASRFSPSPKGPASPPRAAPRAGSTWVAPSSRVVVMNGSVPRRKTHATRFVGHWGGFGEIVGSESSTNPKRKRGERRQNVDLPRNGSRFIPAWSRTKRMMVGSDSKRTLAPLACASGWYCCFAASGGSVDRVLGLGSYGRSVVGPEEHCWASQQWHPETPSPSARG